MTDRAHEPTLDEVLDEDRQAHEINPFESVHAMPWEPPEHA